MFIGINSLKREANIFSQLPTEFLQWLCRGSRNTTVSTMLEIENEFVGKDIEEVCTKAYGFCRKLLYFRKLDQIQFRITLVAVQN